MKINVVVVHKTVHRSASRPSYDHLKHIPKGSILTQGNLFNHVHCHTTNNRQKLEKQNKTKSKQTKVSLYRRMDKENWVPLQNGV